MNSQKKKEIVKKINDNTFLNKIKKVHYSNQIARMNNNFSLEEEKALHIFFSYIKPFNFQNGTRVQIEKKYFFEKLNLVGDSKYKRYKLLVSKLKKKAEAEIRENDWVYEGFIIIGSTWFYKKPFFEIKLNPDFMPYLEQLKEHYTRVDLNTVCAFKSKHALTLYKFLCSWTNESKIENQRYITTKELKELFGLSKEAYVENENFKRAKFEKRTIDVAIKEINQYSDLNITYDKKKENGKVKKYEFIWIQKDKQIGQNIMSNKISQILSDIDKDSEVVFDK